MIVGISRKRTTERERRDATRGEARTRKDCSKAPVEIDRSIEREHFMLIRVRVHRIEPDPWDRSCVFLDSRTDDSGSDVFYEINLIRAIGIFVHSPWYESRPNESRVGSCLLTRPELWAYVVIWRYNVWIILFDRTRSAKMDWVCFQVN